MPGGLTGADVWLVEYSSADRFMIGDERVRLATFENALTLGDTLAFQVTPADTPNTYTLTSLKPLPNPASRHRFGREG